MNECEIQRDRAWSGQFYCAAHSTWFRACDDEPQCCPAGSIAADRDEWMQQHENLLHMYEQATSDLAALKETFVEVNIARCIENGNLASMRTRMRIAAQALIEQIGADGPENVDSIALRAAQHIEHLRTAALPEYLPAVGLDISGDVGRAESDYPGDDSAPHWRIYAEADADDSIRVQITLAWECIADVRVYQSDESIGLWDEAQDISAAILWSALRAWHLHRSKGER